MKLKPGEYIEGSNPCPVCKGSGKQKETRLDKSRWAWGGGTREYTITVDCTYCGGRGVRVKKYGDPPRPPFYSS